MSDDKPAAEEEQKSNVQDYRTLLLQHCFQRIGKEKQNESLKVFYEVLAPGNQTDLPSKVTQEMFVNHLTKLVRNLNLYDLHRKVATATYRTLHSAASSATSEQKKDDYRLFGAADESYASSVRFDLSAEAIKSLAVEIEKEIDSVMDGIAALDDNDLNTKNVLVPLLQLDQRLSGVENSVCFLQNVSPDKQIRDASNEAEKELRKHSVEVSMRKDVYRQIKRYSEKCKDSEISSLQAEWRRFLEFTLRDYRRSGLDLEDKQYERVKEIKKRMSTISSEFQKNCNEENTQFVFEEKELDGMPEDWLKARLIAEGDNKGKYDVNIKYPSLFPVLKQCKVEKTREVMLRANNSRCIKENTPIMEELVKLRYEHAQLLGAATHADHVLEIRMAKTAKTVWDFLHDLNDQMEPLAKQDMEALLKLKKQEKEANNEEFDGVIHEHDFRYYCRLREETEFAIDKEALRPYFPIQTVIDGALNIYQSLMGLKFLQLKQEESQFAFWHEEVLLYQVQDSESGELMGYFFLDLHPRDGKYGHACMCELQSGCKIYDEAGKEIGKQLPINALLCNFPKPTGDKPSLLPHSDVETFFHEFGHSVHQLCGQPACSRFAGTNVERDFVEAPSQMLENWCWKSASLNLMSGHYEDSSRKIPEDAVAALAKSKNANCGLLTKRQLYFGILDQTMHTAKDDKGVDTQKLCEELQPKIWGIEAQKDTNFVASFAHLAGGYDAQYYGYMWSEVFSADMFYSIFYANQDKSLLDPANGKAYREKILAPGGSRDAIDSLKDFLGREPNNTAFLKDKGLST